MNRKDVEHKEREIHNSVKTQQTNKKINENKREIEEALRVEGRETNSKAKQQPITFQETKAVHENEKNADSCLHDSFIRPPKQYRTSEQKQCFLKKRKEKKNVNYIRISGFIDTFLQRSERGLEARHSALANIDTDIL